MARLRRPAGPGQSGYLRSGIQRPIRSSRTGNLSARHSPTSDQGRTTSVVQLSSPLLMTTHAEKRMIEALNAQQSSDYFDSLTDERDDSAVMVIHASWVEHTAPLGRSEHLEPMSPLDM